ncbi:MAG: hypothetical protein ACYCSR_13025 [Thiomonas sp.]
MREAFKDLLKAWGRQQGPVFLAEYPLKTATKATQPVFGMTQQATATTTSPTGRSISSTPTTRPTRPHPNPLPPAGEGGAQRRQRKRRAEPQSGGDTGSITLDTETTPRGIPAQAWDYKS